MENMNNNTNCEPVYTAPAYNATAPVQDNSKKTLIFGILSLALGELGILGLIFAILGKKEAKKYEASFGQLSGKARVGSILSTVGLILSIVMIVFYVLCFIIGIIMGLATANFAMYY